MWCHVFQLEAMPLRQNKKLPRQLKRSALAAACGAVLFLTGLPALAPAESSVFDHGSETSLGFARGTAELLGPDALVLVRCSGARGDTCNGTLTLSFSGNKHKTPFSVLAGTTQSLPVSVGGGDQLAGKRAVAVAKTLQPTGRFARSSEVLRFR
jgi:hypothetical protein